MSSDSINLTTVIVTHRQDDRFFRSLKSVSWTKVIVLIDESQFSSKKSLDLFKKQIKSQHDDVEIIVISKLNSFSVARNSTMKWIETDWTLYLDSDEWVSSELKKEIIDALSQTEVDGFFIPRRDYFKGKQLKFGETASISLLRLGKTHQGRWKGLVHEEWEIKGKTAKLNHSLYHEPHVSLEEFINKINTYTTLVAKERIEKKQYTSLLEMIAFPLLKFTQNYILRMGFRDGWPGLSYAFIMSLHSFFVRVKMWEMGRIETRG